jgi:hypothetical protein
MPVAVPARPDAGLGFGVASLRDPVGPTLADRLTGPPAEAVRQWVDAGKAAVLLRLAFCPGEQTGVVEPVTAPEPELAW